MKHEVIDFNQLMLHKDLGERGPHNVVWNVYNHQRPGVLNSCHMCQMACNANLMLYTVHFLGKFFFFFKLARFVVFHPITPPNDTLYTQVSFLTLKTSDAYFKGHLSWDIFTEVDYLVDPSSLICTGCAQCMSNKW